MIIIFLNSQGLSECHQARIEEYFQSNFWFEGKVPGVRWQRDRSQSIILGYSCGLRGIIDRTRPEDSDSTLRLGVHEKELMELVGRKMAHRGDSNETISRGDATHPQPDLLTAGANLAHEKMVKR